ncbi:MAG: Asp-tRNA(Asn)/Glu-tRNA(Gln) amidotransferase subunit GatC [Planctomycetota bacterium]|jgi:aspartyl-tRNA(Asn)/glutamyl-tRNA(Gln) amidotransferase subunit C
MPENNAISLEQTRKVARLSRLALDNNQLEDHQKGLDAVLDYIERLQELDLDGVEPLANPAGETNRLDSDEPHRALPPETLARMAPESHGPFVKVPKVLGDGGGA